MSLVLHGIPVGKGYAIGKVHLLSSGLDDVPHYTIDEDNIESEIARYENAIKQTKKQLEELRKNIPDDAPTELGAFISFHLMMLSDVTLSHAPLEIIKEQKINAEWALRQQLVKLSSQFDSISDDYLRTRKQDLNQVVEKIYKSLRGVEISNIQPNDLFEDIILVATDISPADAVLFKENRVSAFITDVGGPTSHTAILGKTLDIPSVFGLRNARSLIKEDEWIIVDGVSGVVILDPDNVVLGEYEKKTQQYKKEQRKLNKIKNVSATTLDEIDIEILANIEEISDLTLANKNGANGVGLFRSEFLFLNRDEMPSEEEQFEYYSKLVKKAAGKPVTIRTADIGADKNPRWFRQLDVINPAMGLTGIRLSLAEPIMFRTQMRAILRAAQFGKVKMMWPMIASITELKQCINHLNTAKEQLDDAGVEFESDIEVGIMVEIPSAALAMNTLIKHVDFISIGTNDLIQYTMAVDRGDDSVNYLYQPTHPVILKLISHSIKTANRHNKPVSVCGEMAADSNLTRMLLGMGLKSFSINASSILAVKNAIVNTNVQETEKYVNSLLRNENPDRADALLYKINSYDKFEQDA
ncbi:phosphoenolpyruvate--protein phosphotransferase [Neisseriaceae bacterium PsAf]|nr:phosphoenolpyruvate--protein phosphotransferase [Neisseriaceae bacterium PsAf]